MSISYFIQRPINSCSLPYRIAPCAKAISALLLVFSSTAVWAETHSLKQFYEDISQPKRQISEDSHIPVTDFGVPTIVTTLSETLPIVSSHLNELKIEKKKHQKEKQQQDQQIFNRKYVGNYLKDMLDGKPPADYKTAYEAYKENRPKTDIVTEIDAAATEVGHVTNAIYSTITNIISPEPENTDKTITEDPEPENTQTATAAPEPQKVKKALASTQKVAAPSTPKPAPKQIIKYAPITGHNPQVGSYIANQLAAQQMFIADDLQYRHGERLYTDTTTGETEVTSMWLNTTGSKSRFNSGQGQLHTKSDRYAIQLGGTLGTWSSGGNGQGLLGLTTGLGKSTNHSRSTLSHHQAQGSVDGYNLGLYSIWYADNQTKLGPYIDLLAQHSWFNNQIKAADIVTSANYRSYLFTTALESGYKVQVFEKTGSRFFVQPKAKVLWQRTSGLLHVEPNGTQVRVEENSGVTTKLGVRTAMEFDIDTLSSTRTLQISPSFEANWIHSRMNQGVQLSNVYIIKRPLQNQTELTSINVMPQGNSNIADLKVGIEANVNNNLRLWTHLGHQFGGHNYSDTQASVGANYRF
ncbi:autotransporter outer membrane beta-barrel domain-containing protein [Yersinia vastinensis]|uniref:autotransporter outer membrane beta-barrel domain-containing protein n=1 Tax=Yersinia vastinensis TaxID=2890318 RepID=UPI0005E11689|nr:autotransporter outer membrane beta-barrel domain-containing protein [Yersinia vastinensis]CNI49090.1 type V secretory pathway%2C adhesin AidA [Yersinia frederiksenii]